VSDLDRLRRGVRACAHEGVRRDLGELADSRFDVPIAMLLDLADELEVASERLADPVEVEELHGQPIDARAALDGCTEMAGCGSSLHLSSCPEARR
jgi:hypothetical protein